MDKKKETQKFPVRREVSAGGVVFRMTPQGPEVILVLVKGGKVFCLPKGHVAAGEDTEATAVREVEEETGTKVEPVEKLGSIDYWFFQKENEGKIRIHKIVHFFLFRYVSGSVENHDWEVDDARWFAMDEAIAKASYGNEKEVLEKARHLIQVTQS